MALHSTDIKATISPAITFNDLTTTVTIWVQL